MASTNKTTNYELSQYIGTDKPTYLTDYNQDMSKIDAGIHAAKGEADTNAASIGTLSNLTTTSKTNLVSAINEIDSDVATNTSNISDNTSNISTNTAAIGTLANLTTTSKTNLVSAVNEVNSHVGTLSSLTTDVKSSAVAAINEINAALNKFNLVNYNTCTLSNNVSEGTIRCASNSDGSLFRLYGQCTVTGTAWTTATLTISNTGLPSIPEEYTINTAGFRQLLITDSNNLRNVDIKVKTNGNIEISFDMESSTIQRVILFNGLYFNTNFGD